MAGVLIRMKLAVLRHSMTGGRAAWVITGGTLGFVFAVGTIALATVDFAVASMSVDALGVVLAMWMIGWIVGPVWVGGESALRADHFALLPIPRYRLALGLLGAAFVGITTAVTLLAFTALLVHGARLGFVPTLVAVPAVALQLVFVVLLSRVAVGVFGAVMTSRTGAALTGVLLAAMLVVAQSGWMVYVGIVVSGVLGTGFPSAVSAVIRALPSSWGLLAIDAADRAAWPLAALALTGLAVGIVLLLAVWGRLLTSPRTARAVVRGSSGAAAGRTGLHRLLPEGRTTAVFVKELRTWRRAPSRTPSIVIPPAWALMTCLLPLTFGVKVLLPFAAMGIAVMAATVATNLYGLDGTALWLTLLTPGSERADVRGRQWAWLAVFAPLIILTAVVLTWVSGMRWAWPWVLALVPALIGGGMGLSIWASVVALAPGPDPHRGRDTPLDHGDAGGMPIAMFWLALLPAVPAAALVAAGTVLDHDALRWGGVPVGVGTGVLLAWWLGRVACRRLEDRGPELLSLMRSGRSGSATPGTHEETAFDTMPRWKVTYITLLAPVLGAIALFPQGVVPAVMKLTGNIARVWFLALYLPDTWQWPVIAAMIALGLALLGSAARMYLTHKRTWARAREAAPSQAS